jgi:hypothetical protein
MTYEPGDEPYVEEEEPPPPIPPWRAAAPTTPSTPLVEVLVEAYDDELPTPTRTEQASSAMRRGWAGIGPATRHVLSLAIFAAAVIGALAGVGVAWIHVAGDPLADAHAYYEAAQRLNNGQPLYPPGIDPSGNHIYLYPPLFAIALRPLALLSYEGFALIWELIVIGSLIALLRYLGVRRRATWLGLGLLGVPIGWAVTVAQAHVPMTYLLALGQPWSIAIAANLKLTPVFIAIWWLGRRDYQSFFAFVVYCALFVVAQLVLDFQDSVAYFQRIGFDQLGQVRNISPYVQSPVLWVVLLLAGALVTLALARTRWGWAAAVFLATLAPPRLLIYMLTGLMAALRHPRVAGEADPDDRSDPVAAYSRAAR